MIGKFGQAGIDHDQLAADLQREGADSFVKSWNELLDSIASKNVTLKAAGEIRSDEIKNGWTKIGTGSTKTSYASRLAATI